jgi:hypothetical protein
MLRIATAIAKHAAIFILAILAAVGAYISFAMIGMFSDEEEAKMFTDTNQRLFAATAFLAVLVFIYGLWGLVRLFRTT